VTFEVGAGEAVGNPVSGPAVIFARRRCITTPEGEST